MVLTARVLGWLLLKLPNSPYASTFVDTATNVATVCVESSPFKRDEDGSRCAAILTSLIVFESSGNPKAIGDHGHAKGLFQIHRDPTFDLFPERWEHTIDQVVDANRIVGRSFKLCQDMTLYASGKCGIGKRESEHRINLANWLLAH